MSKLNPYRILDVTTNASQAEIKAAYRALAQQHHPDREGGDIDTFQEIGFAYELLSDDIRRKRYDETGDTGIAPNVDDVAIRIVAEVFEKIIASNAPRDIIKEAKRSINTCLKEIESHIAKLNSTSKLLDKFCNRVTATDENLFQMVLDAKRNNISIGIQSAELEKLNFNRALELISAHVDEAPETQTPTQGMDQLRDDIFAQLIYGGFRP